MDIRIINESISRDDVRKLAGEYYGDMIKGVADIRREIVALGGEMHADSERCLLENGSRKTDLWGFNILLDKGREDCLIFESFINIRPRDQNLAMEVRDPEIRKAIREIVFKRIAL